MEPKSWHWDLLKPLLPIDCRLFFKALHALLLLDLPESIKSEAVDVSSGSELHYASGIVQTIQVSKKSKEALIIPNNLSCVYVDYGKLAPTWKREHWLPDPITHTTTNLAHVRPASKQDGASKSRRTAAYQLPLSMARQNEGIGSCVMPVDDPLHLLRFSFAHILPVRHRACPSLTDGGRFGGSPGTRYVYAALPYETDQGRNQPMEEEQKGQADTGPPTTHLGAPWNGTSEVMLPRTAVHRGPSCAADIDQSRFRCTHLVFILLFWLVFPYTL